MTARATSDQTPVVGDEQKQARSREVGEVNTNTASTPPHPVEEAVAPDHLRRLRRYVEGETVNTVYRLPPNGRHDPLRRDIAALLSALERQKEALERGSGPDGPAQPASGGKPPLDDGTGAA